VLSGEKMWATNGGFADLFIVFAKVDGEHVSAFVVERGFSGVSTGKEEHKMGLHGSSTTPVVLADVKVPAENLLGEVGRGHKVAFNVLNYGRFKLGAMCSGSAKAAIGEAATYASARQQFGQPIATFGAIRHKLAEMTIRAYAVESMLYRTAGLIDATIGTSHHDPSTVASALEEFAVEASLLKVASSEMTDFVVDENVQVHGGNGFVRDYNAERRYRDARVNRIFEGTNEINRLLVPPRLVKMALKGGLPLFDAAAAALENLGGSANAVADPNGGPLDTARSTATAVKQVGVLALGAAAQAYGKELGEQQEVLMHISDALIDAFATESSVHRAERAQTDTPASASLHIDAAATLAQDAAHRVSCAMSTTAAALPEGTALASGVERLHARLHGAPFDTIGARRRIADAVVERQGYAFG
jgi:hypothetical protein